MAPEEPLPSGWLPPRPPGEARPPAWPPPSGPPAKSRPQWTPGAPYAPVQRPPSSPVAVAGIVVGAAGMLVLLLSAGVGYPLAGVMALLAIGLGVRAQGRIRAGTPGRPGQARTAIVVGAIGLGLALAAAVVWLVLSANGTTPQDLQQALERELERQRSR